MTHPAVSQLHGAFRYLANLCDGAIEKDYQGFAGPDTKFGHRVAAIRVEDLTDGLICEMVRVLPKYRKQVGELIVQSILNDLPEEYKGKDVRAAGRQDAHSLAKKADRKVFVNDVGMVYFQFPYDDEVRAALKNVGCSWEPVSKSWIIPAQRFTNAVKTVAEEYGFNGNLPTVENPVQKVVVNVSVKNDKAVWSFPFDMETKNAVKGLPGSFWNAQEKVWVTNLVPQVFEVAKTHKLVVHPDVMKSIGQERVDLRIKKRNALFEASRLSNPDELTPEFLALLPKEVFA